MSDIVIGVVADVFRDAEAGPWEFNVKLSPWRRPGEALQAKPLMLSREIASSKAPKTDPELAPIEVGGILTARAGGMKNCRHVFRAGLLAVESSLEDPEIAAAAAAARPPVVFRSDVLGDIVQKKGQLAGKRGKVEVYFEPTPEMSLEDDVRRVEAAVLEVEARLASLALEAGKELAPTYNEYWRAEDAAEESPGSVAERIELESIDIYEGTDLSFGLSYFDDGLFAGHFIQVHVFGDGPPRVSF